MATGLAFVGQRGTSRADPCSFPPARESESPFTVSTVAPARLSSAAVSPDRLTELAIAARRKGAGELHALLDQIDLPVYLTDARGFVTYFNRACIDFAGRVPVAGEDRWCVTWRLATEAGEFLPHEECPMAVAIRERRPVRGAVALAERPDGSRTPFAPFPTPIFDDEGRLVGAVNILIGTADSDMAAALTAQARRCRRLAESVSDPQTVRTLKLMACDYEIRARDLRRH